ncbi:hypothetical protein [Aquimarina algiphila]|uniref:hypothetical protein n=1 Tax=Aquimarina algiphila TaxID=2047982 RepID=UPI00232EDFA0|nr:hypothetical protein [Aquimarina algiphila]
MHFPYTYINHKVEELQTYLDFLFFEVWMKADGDWSLDKLNGNQKLKDIYIVLEAEDADTGYFFTSRIEFIYKEFLKIKEPFKSRLKEGYIINNNIENLCCNKELIPITFNEINGHYPNLGRLLKEFYSKLYGKGSPFNLKAFDFFSKKTIPDHYREFMIVNNKGICPFCAIHPIKGNNHSTREAYDHYIPKGLYPFIAVNFYNLAPMCHECNSSYKLSKMPIFKNRIKNIDPMISKKNRTLSFYPYSDTIPKINIDVKLNSAKIDTIKPEEIDLEISCEEGSEEQIETWKRIFGLDERYSALLCSPNAGLTWFNSIVGEYENYNELEGELTPEQYFQSQVKEAKNYPLSSLGFLKSKFLEECNNKGLFNRV